LYGTKAFGSVFPTLLRHPGGERETVAQDPGFPWPRVEHAPQVMYDVQMRRFVEGIAADEQPRPSGEDGLLLMRIIDAAYASAASGEVVRVAPE